MAVEDKNIAIHHKGKKRTKEVIHRPYSKEAADIVDRMMSEEYEKEKELGFDPKDINSIKSFNLDYTPIGDNLLVKPMNPSKIITTSADTRTGFYIVVEVSPEVTRPIQRGDIVLLGGPHMPSVPFANRTIKGIKLQECSCFAVAGIHISAEEYQERVNLNRVLFVEGKERYTEEEIVQMLKQAGHE